MAISLAFVDAETSPLPPGVVASFWPSGVAPIASLRTAQSMLSVGGTCSVSLMPGSSYLVIFSGSQAPSRALTFVTNADGSPTTVQIPLFESVTKNAAAYALLQRKNWPKGRFDDPPANVDEVAKWIAQGLSAVDLQLQQILAGLRLGSCRGPMVDAWARRYLGLYLLRYAGELDPAYVNRIQAILSSQRLTLAAITLVVEAWLASVQSLPIAGPLAFDTAGAQDVTGQTDIAPPSTSSTGSPSLAFDTQGAQDTVGAQDTGAVANTVPTIIVFDIQSDPADSATVGLVAGEFCVYTMYPSYTNPPRAIPPPSPDLDAMVRLVKAAGYQPVYADNR